MNFSNLLHWAIIFLVVALFAALLGFGGIAGTAMAGAKLIAHVPIRWNHMINRCMHQIKGLSMILSQKWVPLLRIMLQRIFQEQKASLPIGSWLSMS